MLEIRLLGEIEVTREGQRLTLPQSRKTLALLAYLALTGRRQRRDQLCGVLWERPDDPRAALRWSLSKLRPLVDDATAKRIVSNRDSVAFEPNDALVDILAIRESCAAGMGRLTTERLQELAGMFRGDLLEDLELADCREFEAWRLAQREEAETLRIRILQRLVERLTEQPEQALPFARKLVEVAPERDDLRQALDDLVASVRDAALAPTSMPAAAPAFPGKPSIAVLPFENMSGEAEQEFFVDGIAEDIITRLSKYRGFFVIARNSSFTYKGSHVDVTEVAQQLGVRYVVEGSARKAGDQVRVTAQLIDAGSGRHVWAEQYDRQLDDVFAVQDEITFNIVAGLAQELLSAEMHRAWRRKAPNPGARDCYMHGLWRYGRFTADDNAEAMRLARQGIELDPNDANCYALLGFALHMEFMYDWGDDRWRSIREAHEAALRSVALDDHDSMGYRCLAIMELYLKRHDEALRSIEKAVDLNPNDADGFAIMGGTLGCAGDYEGARANVEKAIRHSPRDPFLASWYNHLAHAAAVAGRHEEAVDWAHRLLQARPHFPAGHRVLASSLSHLGRREEANSELRALLALLPDLSLADVQLTVPIKDPDAMERYLDGLRQAGLPE